MFQHKSLYTVLLFKNKSPIKERLCGYIPDVNTHTCPFTCLDYSIPNFFGLTTPSVLVCYPALGSLSFTPTDFKFFHEQSLAAKAFRFYSV